MSKRSRDKGARGERMLRDVLRRAGWSAERGQQRAGGADSPDVKGGPAGVHFECKFVERLRVAEALDQARGDAGPGEVPIVAWRASQRPWTAILPLDDLLRLLVLAERGANGGGLLQSLQALRKLDG